MPYFTSQSKLGGLRKKRKTNITQKNIFCQWSSKAPDVRLTHQGHHQGKNVYAAIEDTSYNPKYLPLILAFLATIPNQYYSEYKRYHLLHTCIYTSVFFFFFFSKNRKVELHVISIIRGKCAADWNWLSSIVCTLFSIETGS